MNQETPYWVAFNHINGIGAVRMAALLGYFGSLQKAWEADSKELLASGITQRAVDSVLEFRKRTYPEKLTEQILKKNIHITTREDDDYPSLLKETDHCPPVLYHVGKLPSPDLNLIGIVGTRKMTSYGEFVAKDIAGFLADNGVGVVSGLARGVDGTAHQAVLDHNGKTYGVLGCGVDHIYPQEHRDLAVEMVQNGAILSEFAPGTRPDRINFPQRNRIISGMCSAVIIIEAGEKPGSLITARYAAEQGRETFVVPGNVDAIQSRGSNKLIRDGARPFYEKAELLEFLGTPQAHAPRKSCKPLQLSFESKEDRDIVDSIALEPLHIDEISRRTGISVAKISSAVILLELKGFIKECGPQTYQKSGELF